MTLARVTATHVYVPLIKLNKFVQKGIKFHLSFSFIVLIIINIVIIMLASHLPFEIVFIIASYLLTKDKLNCILVCKAWRQPLQDSLWNSLEITSQRKLNSICNTLKRKRSVYKIHGVYVKQLHMSGECRTTDQQLLRIQKSFQNLQRLYIGRFCLDGLNIGMQVGWTLWKSLTELTIDMHKTSVICEKEREKLFSCLPYLKRLCFTQRKNDPPLPFSLDNFEDLHDSLPRLEMLSLNIDLKCITENDQIRLWQVAPTKHMTKINFCARSMDSKWLCYFSLKYPDLNTLGLEAIENDKIPDFHKEEDLSVFSNLPAIFIHLKKASIRVRGCFERSHTVLWNLLSLHTVPVEHLTYRFDSPPYSPQLSSIVTRKCMISCSNTIKTLSIECRDDPFKPELIASVFKLCPNLVDLNIDIFLATIMLDTIIDLCVSLKRFRASNGSLELSKNEPRDPIMHGLRIIELTNTTAIASVFHYLSFHCRKLNYARLNTVKVISRLSNETGNCLVDMHYTQFKVLHIFYVQCFTSYATMFDAIGMNIMVLSKPRVSTDGHTNRRGPFLSQGTQSDTPTVQMWTHTYYERLKNRRWVPATRALMKKEVKFARKYYQDFERNKNIKNSLEVERSWTGELVWNNWKEDLCRGYFVLNCGPIDEYCIHQEKGCDPTLFNRIYSTLD
ncbi:hypothetical protein J3Q64DRAFT_1877052 [Phycomyces blakesleeanus]|uniref:F-box domain-containing protein n=2 Tax=Phycomyces blakesleeanus TaxID=4837 RepID=A0A162WZ37_PHYB8|nr:hypothetical protein PHYBLDRAFT_147418 [Phycomyces blakesleeanus NRRL 1555(-)]OAD71665.1 hypothetical protein PHYBLDRAFT_147418 [Phycomyces blakesleeanus NRRL 1555(-)]|eukprot:XP_018289705.1 hypothetical protein PHYBLDRAFT_147418 [Phycomyces blakesleeanus NRRL 1555(-)]